MSARKVKEKTMFEKAGLEVAPVAPVVDMDYNAVEHSKQMERKYSKGAKNMESNGSLCKHQMNISRKNSQGDSALYNLRVDSDNELLEFLGIDKINKDSIFDALGLVLKEPITSIKPGEDKLPAENKLPVFDNDGKKVVCEFCGGEVYDNTTKPKKYATGPDYKCMDKARKGCNGAAWFRETGGLNWSNKAKKQ